MNRLAPSPAPRALACCLAAAGVLAGPATVAASPMELDTALDYQADADCPARDRFFALLDRAIDPPERSRFVTTRDLRIHVEIRAAAGGYRGSMEKVDRWGASEPRVIVSPICAEVAQALALTAAFSLAPEAADTQPPMVERRQPPASGADRPPSGKGASGAWLLAIGATGAGALSAQLLAGLEGSAGRAVPLGGAALPFTGTLRLRTTYARNDWAGSPPVARFALWTGALEACALPRPFGGALEVGLCASGEAGWLRGRGVQIASPRTTDSLWLAFGGGPLVHLPLGQRWQIEARGALVVPLRRVHFAFETPAQPVGETAAAAWLAALGLVARFP